MPGPGLRHLARRLMHTKVVPMEVQLAQAAPMLQLVKIPGQGRGLFAGQPIPQRAVVLHEAPMLCSPPPGPHHAACTFCLAPGPKASQPWMCDDCAAAGRGGEAWWQLHAACDWAPLRQLCSSSADKFPLMLARVACQQLRPHVPAAGGGEGGRRAVAQGDPLRDLALLCHAKVSPPPPEPWVEQHAALLAALRPALTPEERASARGALDLDWYCMAMARLHLNVFRHGTVDTISVHGLDLFDAATIDLAGGRSSNKGSAVYAMASLVNHSCEPCLDVNFSGNDAVLTLRAARDIDPGEQLTISYVPTDDGVQQRRARLHHAYGFWCRCPRCLEETGDDT